MTPLGRTVDARFGDELAALVAPAVDFSNVVVVDVDEPSMSKLSAQFGAWPYGRGIYALANRYLLRSGAAVVAFDILFSESRGGDEEFAQTLTDKNVLAAVSIPFGGAGHDANYRNQLGDAAWAHGNDWPALAWEDLTLPIDLFTSVANVGVITLTADADGILRRIPLLHRAYGQVLPALAPAVLKSAGTPITMNQASRRVSMSGVDLPTDDQGMLLLRYPKEWRLRVVPFYEVAAAASGSTRHEQLAETFRGKTVYIGSSSAVLGDFAQTPVGRMAGLYIAAAMPTLIKAGHYVRPNKWGYDALHLLAILGLALALASPKLQRMTWLQTLAIPGFAVASGAVVVLGLLMGQKIAVLLPMLAGVLTHFGALTWRQLFLYQRNQRLQVEKLAAEESNRLKGKFLSHMTHELRTPLTAILGFNNINWKTDDLGPTERMANSQVIDRNGRHLLALINGILDQAKLEAGQMRIIRQPENLFALTSDVLTTLRPLLAHKPVSLESKFKKDTPDVVEVDAFRVRQIMLNLVGNAIKFTDTGSVTIEVGWIHGVLSIEVADTGPGMSGEQLSKLFVSFQQGDDRIAATHGGTGLGLTISRDLAALMDGSITVSSQLGIGTRFLLKFPAEAGLINSASISKVQANSTSPPIEPASNATVHALGGVVLVADDADDLRGLTVFHLKRLGLSVLECANGQEAVDIALQKAPDAILMDMEMPVMHGLEAVRTLRSSGFMQPILAMTAHSEPHQITLALAAGCNDVLTKPVPFAALRSALDGALSARRIPA